RRPPRRSPLARPRRARRPRVARPPRRPPRPESLSAGAMATSPRSLSHLSKAPLRSTIPARRSDGAPTFVSPRPRLTDRRRTTKRSRMAKTMRAVGCREPGKVFVHDVPMPEPGPGEVLLRVSRCGICGTDLHWFHGAIPIPSVCPGHEISAVVADVGAGVTGVKPGDRVAVEGIRVCGTCDYCRSSDYQRCRAVGMIGIPVPGGFADYMV